VRSGHEMKCGHDEPSHELTSFKAKVNLKFDHIFELNLKKSDKAFLKDGESIMVNNI